jgi:hypothetical protein
MLKRCRQQIEDSDRNEMGLEQDMSRGDRQDHRLDAPERWFADAACQP